MSNQRERKALEAMIIDTYKDLLADLRQQGLTPETDWVWWSPAARLSHARLTALFSATRHLGMGVYDYYRCDRVISGQQCANEKV